MRLKGWYYKSYGFIFLRDFDDFLIFPRDWKNKYLVINQLNIKKLKFFLPFSLKTPARPTELGKISPFSCAEYATGWQWRPPPTPTPTPRQAHRLAPLCCSPFVILLILAHLKRLLINIINIKNRPYFYDKLRFVKGWKI